MSMPWKTPSYRERSVATDWHMASGACAIRSAGEHCLIGSSQVSRDPWGRTTHIWIGPKENAQQERATGNEYAHRQG